MFGLVSVGLAAAALAVTSIWSTDESETNDETPQESLKRKRSNSPGPIPVKRVKRVRFCEKKNKVHLIAPRPPQRSDDTDSEEDDDDEIDQDWSKRLRMTKERKSRVQVTSMDSRKRKKNRRF
jgi:type IV secretory pathway VirB10-like protein